MGALDIQKVLKSFLLDITQTDSVSASKINIFMVGKKSVKIKYAKAFRLACR